MNLRDEMVAFYFLISFLFLNYRPAAWRVLLVGDESLIVAWALTPMMRLMKKVADSSVGLAR